MVPQSELIHVPDVFQAVARNDEYINIFDRKAAGLSFSGRQTLAQRYEQFTGLDIRQYLRLYFGIYVLYNELEGNHPDEINANPGIINFDTERLFSNMDFSAEEKKIFFERVVTDLPSLIEGGKERRRLRPRLAV